MLVSQTTSKDWSISPDGFGEIVQGLEDINTCIGTILTTSLGSDCMRPEFGTLIYFYIDKPLQQSVPLIMKQISDALLLWEQRVNVTGITFVKNTGNNGGVFNISYTLAGSGEPGQYILKYPF